MAGRKQSKLFFGSELLSHIVPQGSQAETVRVSVAKELSQELPLEHGVIGESGLLKQLAEASRILEEKAPEKSYHTRRRLFDITGTV